MLTGQARRVGTGGMEGLEEMSFENPLVYWIALGIAGLIFGIGTWVGAVNADRRSFKEFMTEVRDDLKKILARLPPRVFAGESPIELTDLGKNISTRLNGKDWAEEHAGPLREKIKGKEPYTVQEMCFEYAKGYEPGEDMERMIQTIAYENGIKREDVLDVLALELRDRLIGPKASDEGG